VIQYTQIRAITATPSKIKVTVMLFSPFAKKQLQLRKQTEGNAASELRIRFGLSYFLKRYVLNINVNEV
jgi:hypothetical protein